MVTLPELGLAACAAGDALALVDPGSGQVLQRLPGAHGAKIHGLEAIPGSCRIASCGDDGAVRTWVVAHGQIQAESVTFAPESGAQVPPSLRVLLPIPRLEDGTQKVVVGTSTGDVLMI